MTNEHKFSRTHNSLFDRGGADSYYGRTPSPHYYENGVRVVELSPEEIEEYNAGFNENEDAGVFKEY